MALSERYDAVVIGTGAGGAPLLARLAKAGLKVVALEAGAEHPPSLMATDELAQQGLYWTDERLSAGADPVAFGRNNSGCGVGGSTLHFTAFTPRPHPDDFRIESEFGVGVDWPLSFEDLEGYLGEVEAFIGVSGPDPYPWGPQRARPYRHPPLPLNSAAQLMQRGCAELGVMTSPAPNAALSRPQQQEGYGVRPTCTNRGFCEAGCSTGAKGSMDVTYLPLARRYGAEIRAEAFVTEIEVSGDRVKGVVYVTGGREERVLAGTVFLCAGAIETPRLLLRQGLANGSGQVGRNFMAHVGLQLWGRFDDASPPYKGIPGALISEDTHRPVDADFAGGYLLQSIGVMPVTYASHYARGTLTWGSDLHEHMRGYARTAGINILGECLPYEQNYMELSQEKDGRGLEKPLVQFSYGENERRLEAHGERILRAIWSAAGGEELWSLRRSAHVIGTARMGLDPASSVVNPDGRCHEFKNLYICDHSVFPSAMSVNPALTIMALSLRTADRYLANRGEA